MAAMTDQQLLDATRSAIDALTTGGRKSMSIAGRTVTKLDLPLLWEQVDRLESRIAAASRQGAARTGVVRFGPPKTSTTDWNC